MSPKPATRALAATAHAEARRARIMSIVWWAQLPVLTVVYWLVSREPVSEKAILVYVADVSIIANAVSYSAKATAAGAKAAGYENP